MSGSNDSIQMVDLRGQHFRLKPEMDAAMAAVINHGKFINGPEVTDFANALANYLNVPHVVPCGNCTDALQMALMALDLEPGDEVITSSFSFVSAVEVVVLLGLKPVLVDVEPGTYNMDIAQVRAAITPRTRVIIPVHLFGQGAAMHHVMQLAREHHLYVVEDAAQCLGAEYRMETDTQKLGCIGHIGCTSFFPSKNLGCLGDGGACFTTDEVLAEKMRMIGTHGARKKYHNERVGVNSRLDTLQAAVLMAKLPYLNEFNSCRQSVAQVYMDGLKELEGIKLPVMNPRSTHVYNQFTVRVTGGRRDALKAHLAAAAIPSMVYYPEPLHTQPAFLNWFLLGFSLPVSEMLTREVLSLPMHTELTPGALHYIVNSIKKFYHE